MGRIKATARWVAPRLAQAVVAGLPVLQQRQQHAKARKRRPRHDRASQLAPLRVVIEVSILLHCADVGAVEVEVVVVEGVVDFGDVEPLFAGVAAIFTSI